MAATMIPDHVLLATADTITIWVATPEAPTDVWSLSDAIGWIMGQPNRARLSLFRPPGDGMCAAWVEIAQIERIAFALGLNSAADAA